MAQISSLRNGVDRFNFAGRNFFRMLEDCADGKNDSWAIRFYASAFLKGGLHVTPASTLVLNGGFDGSGEHCPNRDGNDFISPVFEEPFVPLKRALPWKSNLAEKVIAEKWKKERQERRTEK